MQASLNFAYNFDRIIVYVSASAWCACACFVHQLPCSAPDLLGATEIHILSEAATWTPHSASLLSSSSSSAALWRACRLVHLGEVPHVQEVCAQIMNVSFGVTTDILSSDHHMIQTLNSMRYHQSQAIDILTASGSYAWRVGWSKADNANDPVSPSNDSSRTEASHSSAYSPSSPPNAAIPIRAGLLAILEVLPPVEHQHSTSTSPSQQVSTAFSASATPSQSSSSTLLRPAALHHTASHLVVMNDHTASLVELCHIGQSPILYLCFSRSLHLKLTDSHPRIHPLTHAQRGDPLLVVSSPYGLLSPRVFQNSLSRGIVANAVHPTAHRLVPEPLQHAAAGPGVR